MSFIPRRMGRPPLNNRPMVVRLPDDYLERMDAIAGNRRRADYIREAVRQRLEKDERSLKRRGKDKGDR
jgi:hypothetical protein